jgi:hypothetical protein
MIQRCMALFREDAKSVKLTFAEVLSLVVNLKTTFFSLIFAGTYMIIFMGIDPIVNNLTSEIGETGSVIIWLLASVVGYPIMIFFIARQLSNSWERDSTTLTMVSLPAYVVRNLKAFLIYMILTILFALVSLMAFGGLSWLGQNNFTLIAAIALALPFTFFLLAFAYGASIYLLKIFWSQYSVTTKNLVTCWRQALQKPIRLTGFLFYLACIVVPPTILDTYNELEFQNTLASYILVVFVVTPLTVLATYWCFIDCHNFEFTEEKVMDSQALDDN